MPIAGATGFAAECALDKTVQLRAAEQAGLAVPHTQALDDLRDAEPIDSPVMIQPAARLVREYRHACAETSSRDILLVPGIEYGDADDIVHTVVWGDDVPFFGEGRDALEVLAAARDSKAATVFAHPWRRSAISRYRPAWAPLLSAVEIWNRKYDGVAPHPEGKAFADRFGLTPLCHWTSTLPANSSRWSCQCRWRRHLRRRPSLRPSAITRSQRSCSALPRCASRGAPRGRRFALSRAPVGRREGHSAGWSRA